MKLYAISPFILQNLIWLPTRFTYIFFAHLKILGREKIRNLEPGVIFALNHSSELDPVTLPGAFSFFSRFSPMFYVSREKSFYKKSGWRQKLYGGMLFKIWGAYPAYTGLRDYGKSLTNHIRILNDRKSICIFPEGKKTTDGSLGKARGGVTYLSWATGRPIVPVAVNGSFHSDILSFLTRKKYISITFGDPIYPRELFGGLSHEPSVGALGDDFADTAQLVMREIRNMLGKTSPDKIISATVPNLEQPKRQR